MIDGADGRRDDDAGKSQTRQFHGVPWPPPMLALDYKRLVAGTAPLAKNCRMQKKRASKSPTKIGEKSLEIYFG